MKNELGTYWEAIKQAETDFRTPDGKEMKEKCPYIFSSNNADAYWIAAYCLYHTGKLPRSLHKSRGYTWIVDLPGFGMSDSKVQVQKADQRSGLVFIPSGA